MEFDDRRSDPRVGFKVPAHIHVGPAQALYRGFVMNMSVGGLLVMMDSGVALGTEMQMTFDIPPSISCVATGRIAHIMEMGTYQGVGVELTDTNQQYVHFLRNVEAASASDILYIIKDLKRIHIHVS